MARKPWVALKPENMTKDLIGLQVTVFGDSAGEASSMMWIRDYDDEKIHLTGAKEGGKVKKYDYNPRKVMLRIYQFELGIAFNEGEEDG